MSNAMGWFDKLGLATDDAQNVAFRTDPGAISATNAFSWIYRRMKGGRLGQSSFNCDGLFGDTPLLDPPFPDDVDAPDNSHDRAI